MRVLVVKLGAFGDILHTLPAVATLARAGARVTWVVDPKWRVLLEGNPHIAEIWPFDRRRAESIVATGRGIRGRFDAVFDFQGLIKSALVGRVSGAPRRVGFAPEFLRERAAAWLYTERVAPRRMHVVEQNLELTGAAEWAMEFPLPAGVAEEPLPERFVLASPRAGWPGKEWPAENYAALAERLRGLGYELVLNGPPGTLGGLIHATRRASAVLGLDSGPLHLAAALGKPGVALFGPTAPERNGPYGGTMTVLRAPGAPTTYKRLQEISPAMRALTVDRVFTALERCLHTASPNLTPTP